MKNNVKVQDDTQSLQSCVSVSVTDKEFRIGNLINYRIVDKMDERQEWLEVSEIDYDDLRIFGLKDKINNDYQPILLTKEWLLRFGFKFHKNMFHYKIHFRIGFKKSFNKGFDLFIDDNLLGNEIQYVHQLQNLYFALTGFELQISSITEH